jgi:hypothetical protein
VTVVNTVPPAVSGTARVGQTLSSTNGTWTFDEDYLTYDYQWLRCDAAGANCVDISGANQSIYTITSSDVGSTLRSEVTATEHVSPTPPPPPQPPAINGQGYSLVFEDDFTTLNTSVWRLGAWYIPESPANYVQSGSIVSILNHPSQQKQRDLMTRSLAWEEGYFEVYMRYTANIDSWATTWMMSDNWIRTANCTSLKICEFDMLEANHQYESPTTFKSHFGAAHKNTTGACGMADVASPWSTNWTNNTGVTVAGQWHTFAGLWTASTLKWYLDDVLLKSYPTPSTFAGNPMRWFLGMWSHNYVAELVTEVDWCRVWQQ